MTTALILIDIQKGFDDPFWGTRNNPAAEEKAAMLLAHWHQSGQPIIHIRHVSTEPNSPLGPNTGGTEFKPEVAPRSDEVIFEKSVNAAFIRTGLEAHLRRINAQTVVICGLTTPHCVSTSTRMADNLGFRVVLAHDACAAFTANANTSWAERPDLPDRLKLTAEDIHIGAVSHLHGEFATAKRTDAILTTAAG